MSEKAISTKSAQSMKKALDIPWWLLLIDGIALFILGILFFLNPTMTSRILVTFLGIYWFINGILKIIHIFMDKRMWGLKLFAGILGILAGLLILASPIGMTFVTGSVLVITLGFLGLFLGTAELIQAFQGSGWGVGILGAVSILIGLLLLINTWVVTLALPAILGTLSLIGGIAAAAYAFQLRKGE